MLAYWLLQNVGAIQQSQALCNGKNCACRLPLGPCQRADGSWSEIEYIKYVGHRWHMLPRCTTCGSHFAEPRIGRVCCVCLGKVYGKCSECGRWLTEPAQAGMCRRCADLSAWLAANS